MEFVFYFLAGFFAFNSLPHIISGIIGNKHMTPFGKETSAMVNLLWGFVNVIISLGILGFTQVGIQPPPSSEFVITYLVGGLVISLMDANLFSNPNAKMPWW